MRCWRSPCYLKSNVAAWLERMALCELEVYREEKKRDERKQACQGQTRRGCKTGIPLEDNTHRHLRSTELQQAGPNSALTSAKHAKLCRRRAECKIMMH